MMKRWKKEQDDMQCEALHIKTFWVRVDKECIDEARYAIFAEEYNIARGLL